MHQGMPYFLVKFTGAPDAQCLQGMPDSLVTLATPLRNPTNFHDFCSELKVYILDNENVRYIL